MAVRRQCNGLAITGQGHADDSAEVVSVQVGEAAAQMCQPLVRMHGFVIWSIL